MKTMIDADNHYYEPDDCFQRHIESAFSDRTVRIVREDGGRLGRVFVEQDRLAFFSVGPADFVGAPGAMQSFFRGETEEGGAVNLDPIDPADYPQFNKRSARLAWMDNENITSCIMIPTLGVGAEYQLRNYPDLIYPSLRAFNRWVEEDWGYGKDGKIFSTPLISLIDLPQALLELERLIVAEAKLVIVNTGPVGERSPADPYFDPFWARVQESGLLVVFHIGSTPFCEVYAKPWGESANPPSHLYSAFQSFLGLGERCIVDTIAALIFHNLFSRFPQLRILIIEHGSTWVKHLLHNLDKHYRMNDHKARWPFGKPKAKPSDVFRQHFWIVPFYEDNIVELCETIGAENILAGSDYPHPEGLATPTDFQQNLTELDSVQVEQIMYKNSAELLQVVT